MAHIGKIATAVTGGLSIVCSTCKRYWEGRDKGLPEPKCTAVDGCGSPLIGDDFHEYDGPISDLARWCFVCGSESKFGIRVGTRPRITGVCKEHAKWLGELIPENETVVAPTEIIVSGAPLVVEKPKKSLVAAILEAENYFKEQEK